MAHFNFFLGLSFGLTLTVIIQVFDVTSTFKGFYLRNINPEGWKEASNTTCKADNPRDNTTDLDAELINLQLQKIDDHQFHQDNDAIAKKLYQTVRIACWILTSPQNLDKKAIHVKNTWTKRCNVVVFISSVTNVSFPTVGVNTSEGREHLTAKSMQGFKYLYDHHLDDADWFLKADDDTYVIMENLRYFLSDEDPQKPVYFGQRFRPFMKQGYASGGAGYIISKVALTRFGRRGYGDSSICQNDTGFEDVEMGKCLENLGVVLRPSLDALNRTRFHCFTPETHVSNTVSKTISEEYDSEYGRAITSMVQHNFFLGLCFGLSMTVIIQVFNVNSTFKRFHLRSISPEGLIPENHAVCQLNTPGNDNETDLKDELTNMQHPNIEDKKFHQDNEAIAKKLYQTVRIACWILTSPQNLYKKAIHVRNTWTKRCNVVVFISSQNDSSFPTVAVNATEGRQHLTAKTMPGIGNMSDYAISFHYISPAKMYDLEYYIYHLRPYGILNLPQKLNKVN